jgi:hypothetical protein
MKDELKRRIKQQIFNNGKYDGNLWRKPQNKQLQKQVRDFDITRSYKENVYRILNNYFNEPNCDCGKKVRFLSINDGYSTGCCSIHSKQSVETKQRRAKSNIEKYGTINPSSNEDVKNKRRQTNLTNCGVTCNLHSEQGIKDKIATCV